MHNNNIQRSVLFILLLKSAFGEEGRIYGGYQINIKKAPFMAELFVSHEPIVPGKPLNGEGCGASIVKSNLLISAGHCVTEPNGYVYGADRCIVFVGSTVSHGGEIHYVKKVHVHPKYKGGGDNHFFHDIIMIELVDHISLDNTKQTVAIAGKDDQVKTGDDVFVSGWGTNPEHPNDQRLYQVYMKVISAKKCHEQVAGGTVAEIDEHQICVYGKKKAHCKGDSGGPLVQASTNRQIGVVSYGAANCTEGRPSVYTRITDNLDFINNIMEGVSAMDDSGEEDDCSA